MQYDQDIVDLLTSLKPSSVTGEGGMYAVAMPPPPPEAKPEADEPLFSLRGPAADKLQVPDMWRALVAAHTICLYMCKCTCICARIYVCKYLAHNIESHL